MTDNRWGLPYPVDPQVGGPFDAPRRTPVVSAAQVVAALAGLEDVIGTGEEPDGLCGNRQEHPPHLVTEGSLAPFWCTADQDRREPFRSERRRRDAGGTS